jgi:hypothetical protein
MLIIIKMIIRFFLLYTLLTEKNDIVKMFDNIMLFFEIVFLFFFYFLYK